MGSYASGASQNDFHVVFNRPSSSERRRPSHTVDIATGALSTVPPTPKNSQSEQRSVEGAAHNGSSQPLVNGVHEESWRALHGEPVGRSEPLFQAEPSRQHDTPLPGLPSEAEPQRQQDSPVLGSHLSEVIIRDSSQPQLWHGFDGVSNSQNEEVSQGQSSAQAEPIPPTVQASGSRRPIEHNGDGQNENHQVVQPAQAEQSTEVEQSVLIERPIQAEQPVQTEEAVQVGLEAWVEPVMLGELLAQELLEEMRAEQEAEQSPEAPQQPPEAPQQSPGAPQQPPGAPQQTPEEPHPGDQWQPPEDQIAQLEALVQQQVIFPIPPVPESGVRVHDWLGMNLPFANRDSNRAGHGSSQFSDNSSQRGGIKGFLEGLCFPWSAHLRRKRAHRTTEAILTGGSASEAAPAPAIPLGPRPVPAPAQASRPRADTADTRKSRGSKFAETIVEALMAPT